MVRSLLTPAQGEKLKEHKYNVIGKSIIEPLFQPFWIWVTYKLPVWLAPNVITFTGLFFNVAATAVIIWLCPTAKETPPSWSLLLCLVCLFFYQTLDACDGKQAKRLNQSSPLGEVVDHGCDAVSCLVVAISVGCSLQLGNYPGQMFMLVFNGLATFYVAHWESYVSGQLKFGRFDVTEVQLAVEAAYLVCAIFGSKCFHTKILDLPYVGMVSSWQVIFVIFAIFALLKYWDQFARIGAGGVGKNGSSVADTSVLSPAIPLGLVLLCACYIYKHSSYQVFQNEPCISYLVFGLCLSKLTWKVVIGTMTKHPVDMTDSSMLGPCGLVLINYFSIPVSEYHALVAFAFYEALDFIAYSVRICLDISKCLKINIFTITPKQN